MPYSKENYIKYRDKTLAYKKKHYLENRDRILEYKKRHYNLVGSDQYKRNREEKIRYSIQWRKDNSEKVKEYINQYRKNKNRTDLKCNLNDKMRKAIYYSIRGNKNNRSWVTFIDYTANDLIKHLQKSMPNGYTWQDYMQGKLHIDHKIPISVFNFAKPEHPDFKKCWALKNLRLLPARENLIKGSKLSKPFQPALKISLISKPVPIPA